MLAGGHECPDGIQLWFVAIYASLYHWLFFSYWLLLFSFNFGGSSRAESLPKSERCQLYRELRSCLDITEPRDYSSSEEMVFWSDNMFSGTSHIIPFLIVLWHLGTKTNISFNHTEEDVSSSSIPGLSREQWIKRHDGWRCYEQCCSSFEVKPHCLGFYSPTDTFFTCYFWCILAIFCFSMLCSGILWWEECYMLFCGVHT